jgi:hypothetical protein
MPKVPIDYTNTIIYKIVCNDSNITDLYVGHTTHFIKRKCQHKYSCTNENSKGYNRKVYSTIRDNGGWDNWSMIEVEKYVCNDSNEATARERYWFETLEAKLNIFRPHLLMSDKVKMLQQKKEYREKNKKQIMEYRENNKDKLKEYQKEYIEKNKNKLIEYHKSYRDKMKLKKQSIIEN